MNKKYVYAIIVISCISIICISLIIFQTLQKSKIEMFDDGSMILRDKTGNEKKQIAIVAGSINKNIQKDISGFDEKKISQVIIPPWTKASFSNASTGFVLRNMTDKPLNANSKSEPKIANKWDSISLQNIPHFAQVQGKNVPRGDIISNLTVPATSDPNDCFNNFDSDPNVKYMVRTKTGNKYKCEYFNIPSATIKDAKDFLKTDKTFFNTSMSNQYVGKMFSSTNTPIKGMADMSNCISACTSRSNCDFVTYSPVSSNCIISSYKDDKDSTLFFKAL